MANPNATPDLASVLRALASYGAQPPQTQQQHHQAQRTASYNAASDPRLGGGYDHSQPQHRSHGMLTYEPTSPGIDPATITEWPLGLRCVSQMSHNPTFKSAVRKMIHDQRNHEQQWFKGLDDLVQKQGNPSISLATPEKLTAINNDASVKAYAGKIYTAASEMHRSMASELKALGVPFFGTSAEYIERSAIGVSANGSTSSKISEEQLLKLQRKMVEYLEDMYG